MMGCVFYLYIEKKLASCYAVDIEQQEASAMAKFNSLVPGVEIDNVAEDFKKALKVEQYRLGKEALYFPAGLKWEYLPLSAIESVEGTHRSVTAGHCVTVTERKPAVEFKTAAGSFQFNLEKQANMQKVLDAIEK